MGEYAEMMLDGTCCCQCGDFLGGDEGFPVLCAGCRREEKREPRIVRFDKSKIKQPAPRENQIACPDCGKVVKKVGLPHHMLDKHGSSQHG